MFNNYIFVIIVCFNSVILPVKFKIVFLWWRISGWDRRAVSMLDKQRTESYWSLHRKCFSWMFFYEFSKVLILQICHHLVQSINLWKQMTRISQHQPIDSWSFLPKTHLLDILEIFRLDMGQISSNLLKKAFATWQHAFLSTSITYYDIFAWVCAEIKIFAAVIDLFCCSDWPSTGLASSLKHSEKASLRRAILAEIPTLPIWLGDSRSDVLPPALPILIKFSWFIIKLWKQGEKC